MVPIAAAHERRMDWTGCRNRVDFLQRDVLDGATVEAHAQRGDILAHGDGLRDVPCRGRGCVPGLGGSGVRAVVGRAKVGNLLPLTIRVLHLDGELRVGIAVPFDAHELGVGLHLGLPPGGDDLFHEGNAARLRER
jgi:hypothetical protein